MSAREIAEKVLANKAALSYAEEAALARAYLEAEKALRETYELLLAGEADNALHALDAFLILAEQEPR